MKVPIPGHAYLNRNLKLEKSDIGVEHTQQEEYGSFHI